MSIGHTLLGLLEGGSRHGYDLKRAYDERFGHAKSLAYGQVYSTLSRLLRDGLVAVEGVESGEGPERKRYSITDAGVRKVEEWLATPEKPVASLQNTLYTKLVLAMLSGRDATEVLDSQRQAHLEVMRDLTRRKNEAEPGEQLVLDFALFHLEADLRWLEVAVRRLGRLTKEVPS
ncbi:PadR family transcriptional regulator [Saccharopolyspora erythraea NRRL 2338]|uniref:Transcriptional regulator, PadR-like family n=2 Tax=Saccharopolyspora erythraea TaxID=1836 RepID=A4FFL6_SACEN|nr:PadR family transcriptional regulator [Saccharopolyspora erythraea]EQD81437.1 PadR family transcriptional regulator [Saccharopolyspora erythraea D]PFG96562.1 PadR family transcriptional regulator [Saccharopolyspora erythraea NRRL 2338]QRK93045.1 PadR family transcriptional regulator [Saccharopolyspora erythraea]CAM02841.1 transcriptional regulator, PadR-like family [Saccharopolyspora erythraea NRRL 2338]